MNGWADFAVVIGAATASLLGLLFVAVSFRVETIARSLELRSRSSQTLTLLLTGLLVAALLVVPLQPKWALGVEYLVLALVVAGAPRWLDRRAESPSGNRVAQLLDMLNPTIAACSLLVVTGVVLIVGHRQGLYLLVPAVFSVLVGSFANAWLILIGLAN